MATLKDYEIDFSKEEGGGFRIKEGTYHVKIIAARPIVSSERRTPGVELRLKILDGKLKGRVITERLWASPRAFRRFRSLLEALGKRVPGRVRLTKIAAAVRGGSLYVEVEDQEQDGYDTKSVVGFEGFINEEDYEEDDDEDEDFDDEESEEEEDDDLDDEEDDEDDDEDEDDEDDEDDEPEEYTRADLKELSSAELKEVAEEVGVEDIPRRLSARGRPRLIRAILAAQAEADEDEEEEEPEPAPKRRSRRAAARGRRSRRKAAEPEEDDEDDDDFDLDDL